MRYEGKYFEKTYFLIMVIIFIPTFFLLRLEKPNILYQRRNVHSMRRACFVIQQLENYILLDTHLRFYFFVNFPYVCFSMYNYRRYMV